MIPTSKVSFNYTRAFMREYQTLRYFPVSRNESQTACVSLVYTSHCDDDKREMTDYCYKRLREIIQYPFYSILYLYISI